MIESCINCNFLFMGKCVSEYYEGKGFLIIKNPQHTWCEDYECYHSQHVSKQGGD